MSIRKGRCLCSAVTFEYTGPENWCGHCHCQSCRRDTSSPFTTFIGVPRKAYRFTKKKPDVYQSSDGVRRLFCSQCGSSIAYDSDKYPQEIHFYLACLEKPDVCRPEFHVHYKEKLSWVDISDDLPKYPRSFD